MNVARYLLWRAFRGALTLLSMVAITFALYFAIEKQPPLEQFFPQVAHGTPATPRQVALVRHLLYLDRSKVDLYADYVAHLAQGDFGRFSTIQNGQIIEFGSIGAAYLSAARETLSLLLGGAACVLLLSLPLGALAGSRVSTWKDRTISASALALLCVHPMMLGVLIRSAGHRASWLPVGGYCPLIGHTQTPPGLVGPGLHNCGGPGAWASHLLLPWLTFALLFLALYTRMVRASVAETIHEDFVRTARAKGASSTRLLTFHVLPAAGLRVLTMVGMEIGTAIGVCIYIESVFGIDGLGSAAVRALGGSAGTLDLRADLAIVVLITLIVVVGNFVVDLLYAMLDPRIGSHEETNRSKSVVGGVF